MWAFRLAPAAEELLSSYLSRVAHAHGSTAGPFCRLHLRDSWYWTRDVDRGVAVAQHERLAALSGTGVPKIESLTLRSWIAALTPATYRSDARAAVTQWITAAGLHQARRRNFALAFCPDCLADTGVAVKAWRLAFNTHCDVHSRPLLDACPQCSAPFVPHLSRRSVRHCHACGHSIPVAELRAGKPSPVNEAAFRMQRQMTLEFRSACNSDNQAKQRLHGLRVMLAMCWRRRVKAQPADQCTSTPRIELTSIAARMEAMAWLNRMLEDWPDSFRRLAQELSLTQQTFSRTGIRAAWLVDEISLLPVGQSRVRLRRIEALQAKLSRPRGDDARAENWRATRARALMLAAQRGS